MKPRTFAIATIVFAAIAVTGYAANWSQRKQVRADLERIKQAYAIGDVTAKRNDAQIAQFEADIAANRAASDRASLLMWMGMGGMILAVWSNTFRVRAKQKLEKASLDRGGGPAASVQPPGATT